MPNPTSPIGPVFLTGASGMLAAEIIAQLKEQGYEVIPTDARPRLPHIRPLDITDHEQVKTAIRESRPGYVFHLAAETNVDLCEQKPEHAFRVNSQATENIAEACQENDVPLLYISTAGIFGGNKKEPYTEKDGPAPVNVYGESKLRGEQAVKARLQKFFIVRAGWMVGGWELDKKFVYKIVQQIKQGKTQLQVVSDKFGSPTFTQDFARNLLPLLKTERYGVYHMANKGSCSRYDIALKIVEFMGVADQVRVAPIDSSQFPLPAPRADSEMIVNNNLQALGLNNMPRWEDSLKKYIEMNIDQEVKMAVYGER